MRRARGRGPSRKRRLRRRAPSAPRPRLIGHAAAEAEMLAAYRERTARPRLADRRPGGRRQGDARLARSPASCSPIPIRNAAAGASRARPQRSIRRIPAARHLAALAHPDFALVRREWQADKKRFYTEIRVDDVRAGAAGVPDVGGLRRLARLHRRLRRGSQPQQRQRAPEDDRGAAGALADPDRRRTGRGRCCRRSARAAAG